MTTILNSTADPQEDVQASSEIETLRLEGVLPEGQELTINHAMSILTLSDVSHHVLAQIVLTFSEMCVAVPLLRNFPDYCPYEVLLASFNAGGEVTEEDVARCRRHLNAALATGGFEHEMRPVRNVISRVRLKLHSVGIDVRSLLETGYLLMPRPRSKKRVLRAGSKNA